MSRWLFALTSVALLWSRPAQARRFALFVGDDVGDSGDEKLRYAQDDARRMAQVFVELGGVAKEDEVVLLEQSASEVQRNLGQLLQRLDAQARPGDQLVLYFSGHADEGELHLDGSHLPLALLNEYAKRAPVDVVVLIIDSCRSGSITRLKGLRPLGGSQVSVDVSSMKGRVVIGSSGPDEYAQESETLGGSYFTSHLVAGLRGAADSSHDGVVTLDEAYGYAYAHTIESTFGTRGGVQHPSYHLDLRGQGELALTKPSSGSGRIRLDIAEPAELTITRASSGALVGEFIKSEGPAVLAVPPGAYQVQLRLGGRVAEEAVRVPEGGEARVDGGELTAVPSATTALKGGAGADVELGVAAAFGSGLTRSVPSAMGIAASLSIRKPRLLGVVDTITVDLVGRQASAIGKVAYREQTLDLRAGLALSLEVWRLRARIGPQLGAVLARQTGTPGLENLPDRTRLGLAPEAGLGAAIELRIAGPVVAFAQAFGGGAHLASTVQSRFIWRGDAALGLALRL